MRRLLMILIFFVALSFLLGCSHKDKNEWQTRVREYVPLGQLDNNLAKAPDIIIQFQQREISQIGPTVDKVKNFLDSTNFQMQYPEIGRLGRRECLRGQGL